MNLSAASIYQIDERGLELRRSYMRMTPAEAKQEYRESEGDPRVKGRIKERQREMSRGRMLAAVPAADVVVTNPTHYAVALRYDADHAAPQVVAKGMDHVAARIRAVAAEHGVPIVPDPPLARALHASVDVGRQIPEELFAAVAQVLAFVYRTAGRARMAGVGA